MKILCVGSLNIDRVYAVPHFVQAGETIASNGYSQIPGGKGLNQSIALARAGAQVYHAGAVGEDGNLLRSALQQAGVDVSMLSTSAQPTGHAIIQVDTTGQNSIIVEAGANGTLEIEYLTKILDSFQAGDILLLQNETNQVPWLLQEGKRRKMIVAFNPSPVTSSLTKYPLDCVDIFILNEIEGALLADAQNPADIPKALHQKYPKAQIVLTLGSDGCIYYDGQTFLRQDIFPVNAVDTTAAGDTFCGYFLSCLTKEKPIPYSLRMASAAAALAVTRPGASVSIPTWKEVEDFLDK